MSDRFKEFLFYLGIAIGLLAIGILIYGIVTLF